MIINAIKKFIKKPFVGAPAPAYLEDDPWFGPATLSEKQLSIKEAREQLVEENQLVPESEDQPRSKEVDNIHEVLYNMATRNGKTTTQLNPIPKLGGGSEQYQTSPGGWTSGNGFNQLF